MQSSTFNYENSPMHHTEIFSVLKAKNVDTRQNRIAVTVLTDTHNLKCLHKKMYTKAILFCGS